MTSPRISVVLPTLNAASHVQESIQSLLEQTERNFELLVMDGGSTDRTLEIVAAIAAKDARVVLHPSGRESLVDSLNRGVATARAPYIARMDADDVARPSRFQQQADFLDANPDVAVVGAWSKVVASNRQKPYTWRAPTRPLVLAWSLLFGNWMHHGTTMLRKAALPKNPYRSAARHAEDYDLWQRVAARADLANIPRVLVERREGPLNVSNRHEAEQQTVTLHLAQRAMEELLGKPLEVSQVRALRDACSRRPVATLRAVEHAETLLLDLHGAYLDRAKPGHADRRALRADLADRLGLLALAAFPHGRMPAVRLLTGAFAKAPGRVTWRAMQMVFGLVPDPASKAV